LQKKRLADEKAGVGEKPPGTPEKAPKKVQPAGFNPLVGMKSPTSAVKYDKCTDCSCNDFSPDTFKKGKCSNCFHIHPVSKDQEDGAPPGKVDDDDDEQPPPPAAPYPGGKEPAKADKTPDTPKPEATKSSSIDASDKPAGLRPSASEASIPAATAASATMSPKVKKLSALGAKGFNPLAGMSTPTAADAASSEPVGKCKECGCEDFSPDPFKKNKCMNCFHIHAPAPPPPKKEEPAPAAAVTVEVIVKCKECGCGNFKPDAFKKTKCANCFHSHV